MHQCENVKIHRNNVSSHNSMLNRLIHIKYEIREWVMISVVSKKNNFQTIRLASEIAIKQVVSLHRLVVCFMYCGDSICDGRCMLSNFVFQLCIHICMPSWLCLSWLGHLAIWVTFPSGSPTYLGHIVWVKLCGLHCVGQIVCITLCLSHFVKPQRFRWINCDKYCMSHGLCTFAKI